VTLVQAHLVFEDTNGCAVAVCLRGGSTKQVTVSVTISATNAGERLPAELFKATLEKR
jgi:hypothetical protein